MTQRGAKRFVYCPLTQERRFLAFRLDPASGELSLAQELELPAQPWQLCAAPDGRRLYQQVRDDGYSGVLTLAIDPATGMARIIGEAELEADACYVSTDVTGRTLLAAYLLAGMVTAHAIGDDGTVGALTARRETALYAHSVIVDRTNRYAYAPHVAPTDEIHVWRFDATSGALTPASPPALATPCGHGPRHLAFHPTLNVLYANAERASTVDVYACDPADGGLRLAQSLATLPDGGFDGANSTGTIRVHPSGNAVYATNRGHDSVAIFTVDGATGMLSVAGHAATRAIPRTLGVDARGRLLFAGSDAEGVLSVYAIDAQGGLTHGRDYNVGMWPSWVQPLEFS